MSNTEVIRELCEIIKAQDRVICAQSEALEQLGAIVMEEEKAALAQRCELLEGIEQVSAVMPLEEGGEPDE